MTIKKTLGWITGFTLLFAGPSFAEVPHTINLQSMIFDEDGNVSTSESVDLLIKILDGDGNILFSEEHADVPVVKGAVNVSIGEPSGGIPLEILDPSAGTKVLDVVVDGTNPFELMPLGAVPYAMWAEKALTVADESIGSEQIRDGSIKVEDLDPLEFADIGGIASEGQLPGSVATDAELSGHTGSGAAHLASAIVVSGSFVTFVADDVQEALEKLDGKLAEEIVNRQSGQTTAATNITNLQTATSNINNIPGTLSETKIDATIARDSEVIGIADAAFTTNAEAAVIADSRISNAISTNVIPDAPSDIGAAPAAHDHDAAYVNVGGDTMTGPLNVPDEGGTALSGGSWNIGRGLRDHETRIDALEGDTIQESDIPPSLRPRAWGQMEHIGTTGCRLNSAFHATTGNGTLFWDSDGLPCRVFLDFDFGHTNYVVLLTGQSSSPTLSLMNGSTFRINYGPGDTTGIAHFVVFGN